jgi:sugar phosphate isomerase/epimerase
MGQNWGGFKLQWEPVWDIFGLMDEAGKLGLDGLHLTAADLGATGKNHLRDVRRAAEERGLYLEYNFSLDASGYDDRLTHTMEEGVAMREALQVIKANPNMKRLNIEVEFDPGADGREEARRREYQAVVDSIRFTREELGVGQESEL